MMFVIKLYFNEIMIECLYVKNSMNKSGPHPFSIFQLNHFFDNLFKLSHFGIFSNRHTLAQNDRHTLEFIVMQLRVLPGVPIAILYYKKTVML